MDDYTLVCGVDRKHLRQLSMVWPTWKKHKPTLLERPMLVFFDGEQVTDGEVRSVVDHPGLRTVAWPPEAVDYGESGDGKWESSQRHRMLASFVHVPPMFVRTRYWLKLDTDTIAKGMDDWIDPHWFDDDPVIVSHKWGFTKPPDQMAELDRWVEKNRERLPDLWNHPPLDLHPEPGRSRLSHKRIISWCAFFDTGFTNLCSNVAEDTCGRFRMPVPSQDGFMWYMATRMGLGVRRTMMKSRGWLHRSTMKNVRECSEEAMRDG